MTQFSYELDFHFAATTYLTEYVTRDLGFRKPFAAECKANAATENLPATLSEMAAYYGVSRTLKTRDGDKPRLSWAVELLMSIESVDPTNVVETVETLAANLQSRYESGHPTSAASKFLWMRFRSPVVIYDSIVAKMIGRWCKGGTGYRDYYDTWRKSFDAHQVAIANACQDLIQFEQFTVLKGQKELLAELANAAWFHERVFDHAMVNNVGALGEALRR